MDIVSTAPVFVLTSNPVMISGKGANTFTYQITGSGTATIQGSNDGVNWFPISSALTAPNSLVAIHSWQYLMSAGTANVLVSRA